MRQGHRILLAATAELAFTLMLPPSSRTVFLYITLTTAVVGLSSLMGWTRLFLKRSDGWIPLSMLVIFWPWHTFLWVVFLMQRTWSKDNLYDEVAPGWILGAWPWDHRTWERWPAVVDLTCELPRRAPAGTPYLNLPTWDGTAPTQEAIRAGVDFALTQRALGRRVLIHCAAGHGRSATVMAAALTEGGLAPSWQEAVALMRRARPSVRLIPEQEQALSTWAQARPQG
ncbi:MAG: dual specificity protein phosphatase family protein [Deltaproteobacteria bacterium]|nr:dual specificity protein phosphatase family protein [Deltaproteobacteria bacterium]